MALSFNGTSSKLVYSGKLRGYAAYPISIFAWIRSQNIDNKTAVMYGGVSTGSAPGTHDIGIIKPAYENYYHIAMGSQGGAGEALGEAGDLYNSGKWDAILGVYHANVANISRCGYSDAFWPNGRSQEYSLGASLDFNAFDKLTVGCYYDEAGGFWQGDIAEVAFWRGALGRADYALLKAGVRPDLVRPNDLLEYWSLEKSAATQVGKFGTVLTATNTSTTTRAAWNGGEHPRVWVPVSKPATTGEPDGVSINYKGIGGSGYYNGGVGTYNHSVTLEPHEGFLACCVINNGPALTVTSMTLSADGPATQLFTTFEGITHAVWANISEAKQTLTLTVAGGDGTTQGGVYLFSVAGHDKQRMIGYFGTCDDTALPFSPTMQQKGSALFMSLNQYWSGGPYLPCDPYQEQWTPGYGSSTAYWWNEWKQASINGGIYGGGGLTAIEIRRGEKQRRSRFITVREPWTTQPQGNVEIDWDHPANKSGVELSFNFGSGAVDLSHQGLPVLPNAIPTVTEKGRAYSFAQGSGAKIDVSDGKQLSVASVAALFYLNSLASDTSYQRLFSFNENFYLILGYGGGGFMYFNGGGTTAEGSLSVGWNSLTFSCNGTYSWVCINGVHFPTTGSSTIGAANSTARTIGNRSAGDRTFDGKLLLFHMVPTVWSAPLLQSVSMNPWQLFKPRIDKRIFTGSPVLTHKRRRIL
jgi:hypothetical protein